MEGLTGVEAPKGLSRFRIHGFEFTFIIAKEDEARSRSHSPRPGITPSHLRVAPRQLARHHIEGAKDLLRRLSWRALGTTVVVGVSGFEDLFALAGEVDVAVFETP